ncbi:MAG TPA: hypothetical protein VG651_13755 [Stellaceae bacterium]|nr:hypothetical protein [Stellaceae bacterium]
MAEKVEITIGANIADAVDALGALQRRFDELTHSALQATQTMRQADAAYLAAFRNGMQVLVDSKQVSLQQALGFDIDYTAQLFAQEQARLQAIRDSDKAAVEDRLAATAQMRQADLRYMTQIGGEYRQLADAARSQADRVAQSYERAFDRVGGTVQHSFNEILTGQATWSKGMTRVVQEVETFFLEEVETMAAKWAASGLAGLAGGAVANAVNAAQGTGASGLGAGLMALLGINQPGGLLGTGLLSGAGGAAAATQAAAITANTTALGASTSAMAALTAALTGTTAAATTGAGATLAGGAATTAGAAAGGGGLFPWIGGLFGFAKGGIVPSAAGGWAVPNLAGATPALLHAREMVLPADISQGLQGMIAAGGAGDAHFHAHFHGPADAPAVSRWFRDNLRSNAGALRDLFRQNALTPRSF